MQFAYVKTQFVGTDEAVISIQERGFRFGDGLFETIVVHNGLPYQWEFHMDRLREGLISLKIPDTHMSSLRAICSELIEKNALEQGFLRIYISRGIGGMGYLPPRNIEPLLVVETLPRAAFLETEVSLWLSTYERISASALPMRHKLAQGLNSTLARLEAEENGCFDALQLTTLGQVAEVSSANIFWYNSGILFTPSLASGALAGSTRHALMRLSPYPVEEGAFGMSELKDAEAVFITNARLPVAPVSALKPLGWKWDSTEVAETLKLLILSDMQAQCRR